MFSIFASGVALGILSRLRTIHEGTAFEYSPDIATSSLTLDQLIDTSVMSYSCEYGTHGFYNHLPMSLVALEQLGASPRIMAKSAQFYSMRLRRIPGEDFSKGSLEAKEFLTQLGEDELIIPSHWFQTKSKYCTLLAAFDSYLSMAKNSADVDRVKAKTRQLFVQCVMEKSGIAIAIFHPIIQVAYNLIALDSIGKNHVSTKAISSALAFSADTLKENTFFVRPSKFVTRGLYENQIKLEPKAKETTEFTSLWQLIDELYKKREYFISTMQANEAQLKRNLIVDTFQQVALLFKDDIIELASQLSITGNGGHKKHAAKDKMIHMHHILDEIHEFATEFLLTVGVSDLITLHLVTGSHAVRVVLEKLFYFRPVDGASVPEKEFEQYLQVQEDMIQQLIDTVIVGYIFSKLPYVDRAGIIAECKQDVEKNVDTTMNWPAIQKLVIRDEHADEHHVKFLYTCKELSQRLHCPEVFMCAARKRCESRKQ